jgi:type II secretory pathway pseudopilin PulG
MVVLVIIGLLAAVATPSLTRDSSARKGRDFVNMVAQGLQRAHLDAMGLRVSYRVQICSDGMDIFNTGVPTAIRSVFAPPSVAIWDANTDGSVPADRVLGSTRPNDCAQVFFNPTGNAGVSTSSADLATWKIYVRNENFNPNHPDGGFVISVTGLTAFVSMRDFTF